MQFDGEEKQSWFRFFLGTFSVLATPLPMSPIYDIISKAVSETLNR
jgi:hypothetical protein